MFAPVNSGRGGRREGAARHPSDKPVIWLQVGVSLSDREIEHLTSKDLTPVQRRHRLLTPDGRLPEWYREDLPYEERRQYNFRIVLDSIEQRAEILGLKMPTRRQRLLAEPPGGDTADNIPGQWGTRRPSRKSKTAKPAR